MQGKPNTLIATLPQQWQQQRAHCWILSWKLLPQKVVGVSTPIVLQHLPNENIWFWVKQAVYTNGLVAKKNNKIESSDKISSQESLKTCTKKNFTHTQNLAEHPIEVHFSVFLLMPSKQNDNRRSVNPKK